MLSLFPQFFDWSWYVPFFFRMFLAGYLLVVGYHIAKFKERNAADDSASWMTLGGIVMLFGVSFLVGAWVQLTAIVTFSTTLLAIWFRKKGHPVLTESKIFYFLLGFLALSLLFLGPGPFAFDLPL